MVKGGLRSSTRALVIPGCASWRRPQTRNCASANPYDREYGFRARSPSAKLMLASILSQDSRPGMTNSFVVERLRIEQPVRVHERQLRPALALRHRTVEARAAARVARRAGL